MRVANKRCRYVCSIHDANGKPEFRVLVQEPSQDDIELRDSSPRAVWQRILEPMAALRKQNGLINLFPRYLTGEDLFGLTEPAVVRVLESLPGETLFCANPTGCIFDRLSWNLHGQSRARLEAHHALPVSLTGRYVKRQLGEKAPRAWNPSQ